MSVTNINNQTALNALEIALQAEIKAIEILEQKVNNPKVQQVLEQREEVAKGQLLQILVQKYKAQFPQLSVTVLEDYINKLLTIPPEKQTVVEQLNALQSLQSSLNANNGQPLTSNPLDGQTIINLITTYNNDLSAVNTDNTNITNAQNTLAAEPGIDAQAIMQGLEDTMALIQTLINDPNTAPNDVIIYSTTLADYQALIADAQSFFQNPTALISHEEDNISGAVSTLQTDVGPVLVSGNVSTIESEVGPFLTANPTLSTDVYSYGAAVDILTIFRNSISISDATTKFQNLVAYIQEQINAIHTGNLLEDALLRAPFLKRLATLNFVYTQVSASVSQTSTDPVGDSIKATLPFIDQFSSQMYTDLLNNNTLINATPQPSLAFDIINAKVFDTGLNIALAQQQVSQNAIASANSALQAAQTALGTDQTQFNTASSTLSSTLTSNITTLQNQITSLDSQLAPALTFYDKLSPLEQKMLLELFGLTAPV